MNILKAITVAGMAVGLMFAGGKRDDHDHSMMNLKTMTVDLPSVQCGMCEMTITRGLSKLDGIQSVSIDVDNKNGQISYDSSAIEEKEVEKAIADLGYFANGTPADKSAYDKLSGCCQMSDMEYTQLMKKTTKMSGMMGHMNKMDHQSMMKMDHKGMNMNTNDRDDSKMIMISLPTIQCENCQQRIEGNLSKMDGILEVKVMIDSKMAHVVYDPEKQNKTSIESAISLLGYQANKLPADKNAYNNLPSCCQVN